MSRRDDPPDAVTLKSVRRVQSPIDNLKYGSMNDINSNLDKQFGGSTISLPPNLDSLSPSKEKSKKKSPFKGIFKKSKKSKEQDVHPDDTFPSDATLPSADEPTSPSDRGDLDLDSRRGTTVSQDSFTSAATSLDGSVEGKKKKKRIWKGMKKRLGLTSSSKSKSKESQAVLEESKPPTGEQLKAGSSDPELNSSIPSLPEAESGYASMRLSGVTDADDDNAFDGYATLKLPNLDADKNLNVETQTTVNSVVKDVNTTDESSQDPIQPDRLKNALPDESKNEKVQTRNELNLKDTLPIEADNQPNELSPPNENDFSLGTDYGGVDYAVVQKIPAESIKESIPATVEIPKSYQNDSTHSSASPKEALFLETDLDAKIDLATANFAMPQTPPHERVIDLTAVVLESIPEASEVASIASDADASLAVATEMAEAAAKKEKEEAAATEMAAAAAAMEIAEPVATKGLTKPEIAESAVPATVTAVKTALMKKTNEDESCAKVAEPQMAKPVLPETSPPFSEVQTKNYPNTPPAKPRRVAHLPPTPDTLSTVSQESPSTMTSSPSFVEVSMSGHWKGDTPVTYGVWKSKDGEGRRSPVAVVRPRSQGDVEAQPPAATEQKGAVEKVVAKEIFTVESKGSPAVPVESEMDIASLDYCATEQKTRAMTEFAKQPTVVAMTATADHKVAAAPGLVEESKKKWKGVTHPLDNSEVSSTHDSGYQETPGDAASMRRDSAAAEDDVDKIMPQMQQEQEQIFENKPDLRHSIDKSDEPSALNSSASFAPPLKDVKSRLSASSLEEEKEALVAAFQLEDAAVANDLVIANVEEAPESAPAIGAEVAADIPVEVDKKVKKEKSRKSKKKERDSPSGEIEESEKKKKKKKKTTTTTEMGCQTEPGDDDTSLKNLVVPVVEIGEALQSQSTQPQSVQELRQNSMELQQYPIDPSVAKQMLVDLPFEGIGDGSKRNSFPAMVTLQMLQRPDGEKLPEKLKFDINIAGEVASSDLPKTISLGGNLQAESPVEQKSDEDDAGDGYYYGKDPDGTKPMTPNEMMMLRPSSKRNRPKITWFQRFCCM